MVINNNLYHKIIIYIKHSTIFNRILYIYNIFLLLIKKYIKSAKNRKIKFGKI